MSDFPGPEVKIDPVAKEREVLNRWLDEGRRGPGESGEDYDNRVTTWRGELASLQPDVVSALYNHAKGLNPVEGTVDTDNPERKGSNFIREAFGKIVDAKRSGVTGVLDVASISNVLGLETKK